MVWLEEIGEWVGGWKYGEAGVKLLQVGCGEG